ncbi:MAG TPA: hypothetical protein PK156_20780 [Polyangium sp.]|nr:hypothetical protein [Polyangium sp.]
MSAVPSLHAESFLFALRAQLKDAPPKAIENAKQGAAGWSGFMFSALADAAGDCGMVCCASRLQGGPQWARREHLFDITWYRHDCGDWETPIVILEHENQWNKREFLVDFWKLLLGYAPLRVMIGYCAKAAEREEWVDSVNSILNQRTQYIGLPDGVEDLILLGHKGMATTGFSVYQRRDREFTQTADSLEVAVMPNPHDLEAWNAYLRETQKAMAVRAKNAAAVLREKGIIDEAGNLLVKTLPADMLPASGTSVITG